MDNATGSGLVAGSFTSEAAAFIRACDANASDAADHGAYRSPDAQGRLTCPACAEPLDEFTLDGDIVVDLCVEHGTFFDRLEVSAFRFDRAMQSEKTRVAAQQRAIVGRVELDGFRTALKAPTEEDRRSRHFWIYAVIEWLARVGR